MSITYVVMLALLTGTHAATWGAFKDSPFEGFKPVSFARTIVLAVLAALVLALTTALETTTAPLVFVGLIYAVERLATELWKSFIREDDQDAYAIPMRIAVLGRTVDGRPATAVERRSSSQSRSAVRPTNSGIGMRTRPVVRQWRLSRPYAVRQVWVLKE